MTRHIISAAILLGLILVNRAAAQNPTTLPPKEKFHLVFQRIYLFHIGLFK